MYIARPGSRFLLLGVALTLISQAYIGSLWASPQGGLSVTLGRANGYVDNTLGGSIRSKSTSVTSVNDNYLQLQVHANLLLSNIAYRMQSGSAIYRLSVSNSVSSSKTLAKDSSWSSASQRQLYSESLSSSTYRQWNITVANRLGPIYWGVGTRSSLLTFYNHDGVEKHDLVPSYNEAQVGSILDYSASYVAPYVSLIYPHQFFNGIVALELQVNYSPYVSALETEKHYWRGYRATTQLLGSGYELQLQSRFALDKQTRLKLDYKLSQYSLTGRREYENYDIIYVDEKHHWRQWRLVVGLVFEI